MLSFTKATAAVLIVCTFPACERREIEKAKDAVLEQSAKLNHESILIARSEVRRLWAVEGEVWYGKLTDGTILRLDSPRVESRTKNEGRKPFCRWSGEITITATRWKSNPPTDTTAPISVTYSVLMQDSKRMSIDPTEDIEVEPPTRAEIAAFPKN